MLKWLLLFAIAYVAFRFWLRALPKKSPSRGERAAEPMIACAECGTHVPQSEAICGKDRCFCSIQHRDSWTPKR